MYTSTIPIASTLIPLLIILPLISCFPAPVSLNSLLAEPESSRSITLSSRSPEPKKHHHHEQADPARPVLPNGAVANAFVRARSAQSASAAAGGGPTFGAATSGEEDRNELFERDGVTETGKGEGDGGDDKEEGGKEEEEVLVKRDYAALAAIIAAIKGASAKGNGNAVAQAGK